MERTFRPQYLLFLIVLTFPIGLLSLLVTRTYSVTVTVIPEPDRRPAHTAAGVGADKLATFVEGTLIEVAESTERSYRTRGE